MSLFYHIFLTPFLSFCIFYHSINHINNPLRPISWLNMGSFLLFPNHVFQVFLNEFVIKCYKTNIYSLYLKCGLRFVMCRNIWRKSNKKNNGASNIFTWFGRRLDDFPKQIQRRKIMRIWYDVLFWKYERICEDLMRICIL